MKNIVSQGLRNNVFILNDYSCIYFILLNMPISFVLVVEGAEWMKSGNDICQWRMVAYMSQQAGKEAYQGHVDGVIEVEELAEPAPAATLAVV